jgi:hypothetical protein
MLSKSAMDSFTTFYQTAAAAEVLSERESLLVRLATSMALGCAP